MQRVFSRYELLPYLNTRCSVTLSPHVGDLISPRSFMRRELSRLSEYEQNIAIKLIHHLPDHTNDYPFNQPLAVASSDNVEYSVAARAIGGRSAMLESKGIYIKACRPIDDETLWFPTTEMNLYNGSSEEKQIAFGVMSAENVARELLGYLFFLSRRWSISRFPVAVLRYQMRRLDGYALVFRLEPGFFRVEQLFIDRGVTIDDLIAAEMADGEFGIKLFSDLNALRLSGVELTDYLAGKADFLATTHGQGFYRGYLNANAGNDIYNVGRKETSFVDFDTAHLVDTSQAVSIPDRVGLLRSAFIEAAKSMLPTQKFVWVNGMEKAENFRLIEREVLENGWMTEYTECLKQQVIGNGWTEKDVALGQAAARKHPLYRSAITDAVIVSQVLLNSYTPAESLYRPQY